MNAYMPKTNVFSKVVILNCNVTRPGAHGWSSNEIHTTLLSSNTVECALAAGSEILQIELSSCRMVRIGSRSRREVERAIYSASVVDRAISNCDLEDHRIGQPTYVITYPVLDFTLDGSFEVLCVHVPAKYAST